MKKYKIILLLVFIVGCSAPKPIVSVKQVEIRKNKEKAPKVTVEVKEEKPATRREIAMEKELIEEITGLIIERTMTKVGYEFYESFSLSWETPEGVKDYNIIISERASPSWGSWIQIEIETNTVWSKVIKPRSEEVEEAVKEALNVTRKFLEDYERWKKELEGPDMLGDGI